MNGMIKDIAQNKDTFPKLWCQKSSAINGNMAIERSIPTNGITQNIAKDSPFRWGAPP